MAFEPFCSEENLHIRNGMDNTGTHMQAFHYKYMDIHHPERKYEGPSK